MKKTALYLTALALLLTLGLPALGKGDKETLIGEYRWNSSSPSKLRAVFTPTDADRWKVAFHFRFRGQPHTYRGTAEGSLEGDVRGKVTNEGGGRKFTFRLENDNGTLSGTHAEVFGRRESSTGTLTLRRSGQPAPGVI